MKAKELMPKRYPNELPTKSGSMWVYRKGDKCEWVNVGLSRGEPDYTGFTWFIDIPGAPDEVKPVAYPAHKPSEDGKYICHIKYWIVEGYVAFPEEWMVVGWKGDDWECVRERIDYFIDIRLDEPVRDTNKLESEEDVSKLDMIPENIIMVKIFYDNAGLTRSWHKGCAPKEIINGVADAFGYDVKALERQPVPCPFCKAFVEMEHCYISDKKEYYLVCDDCGYCSCHVESESEAIRLHNQIAGR